MKKWITVIIYSTLGVVIFGILAYLVWAFIPGGGDQSTPTTGGTTVTTSSQQNPGRSMMNTMMGNQSNQNNRNNRNNRNNQNRNNQNQNSQSQNNTFTQSSASGQSSSLYQRSIQSGGGREVALFFYYTFAVLVILSALVLLIGLIGLAVKYFERDDRRERYKERDDFVYSTPSYNYNESHPKQPGGSLHDL